MKTEKKTNKKFALEKFEVVKLKNLNLVKGGQGGGPDTGDVLTTTGVQDQGTSRGCYQD